MYKAHHKFCSICSKSALLILLSWCSLSYAVLPDSPATSEDIDMNNSFVPKTSALMLVATDCIDEETKEPCDGALIIPGNEQEKKSEKQCVRVCAKWGKQCNINPRTGQRKCMRTCEKFGEDCF